MNSTSRISLQVLGFISLILGFIGAFVPVLPTTPFILVSAWCFAKTSPKWHRYIHDHREFGPMVENWRKNRSIALKHKITATAMMALSLTGAWLSDLPKEFKAGLSLGLAIICFALWLVKTATSSSIQRTPK